MNPRTVKLEKEDREALKIRVEQIKENDGSIAGLFDAVLQNQLLIGSELQVRKKELNPITNHDNWLRLTDLFLFQAYQFNKVSEFRNQYDYELASPDDLIVPATIVSMDVSQLKVQLEMIKLLQTHALEYNPLTSKVVYPRLMGLIDKEIDAMYLQSSLQYNFPDLEEGDGVKI